MHPVFTTISARMLAITGCFSLLSFMANAQALSGNYTIDAAQSGPTNFTSFNNAVTALTTNGISGTVVFNVAPGTYNEQVIIPPITGVSAQHTISFNGNESNLFYHATNSAERATLKLNGASYISINNMKIGSGDTAITGYCYGIQLINNADFNKISNCIISVPVITATNNNFAGIVINSDAAGLVTEGDAGCDNNTISRNTVRGGQYGIALVANGSINMMINNKVNDNKVIDFFNTGVFLDGNNNATVDNNDISRPARSSAALFYGIQLNNTSFNTIISNNKIHDPFGGTTSYVQSSANGIYFTNVAATAANPNRCFNNILYNIQSNSIVRGIWINSSPFNQFMFNTLSLDDANYANVSATTGFEISGTTDLTIQNNIISIKRMGSSFSTRTGINLPNTAGCTVTNNDIYLPAGNTLYFAKYGTTNCITLNDWMVNTGDNSSRNVDPAFVSMATGNLTPTNQNVMAGTPTDVATDITGASRSMIPTIGAFEMQGAPLPIVASALSVTLNEDNSATLTWKSFTEAGNQGFEIQKSSDATSWSNMAFVVSKKVDGSVYSFTDNEVVTAKVYYRFVQLDENGSQSYSNVVWVTSSKTQPIASAKVIPNPADDFITLQTSGYAFDTYDFVIYNQLGKTVSEGRHQDKASAINISNLPAGLYFIRLKTATQTFEARFVKQ